ncbi:MAG TPA: hypothetical protein VF620_14185 [Allosphingosinicella sp.]|jgi:hypothetical protein
MRDLLSKVMTGSMVAGAALLVAACGGGEDAAANNTAMNYTDDALMANTGDVTGVDALNATTDSNALGTAADMNATTTMTNTTTTTNSSDAMMNTGTGTGNTTGM